MKLDIKKIWNRCTTKWIVRAAIFDSKRHGILFVGPPACAKTLFLEAVIEEAGEGLYFDCTNTTNRILDVLEQERPLHVRLYNRQWQW